MFAKRKWFHSVESHDAADEESALPIKITYYDGNKKMGDSITPRCFSPNAREDKTTTKKAAVEPEDQKNLLKPSEKLADRYSINRRKCIIIMCLLLLIGITLLAVGILVRKRSSSNLEAERSVPVSPSEAEETISPSTAAPSMAPSAIPTLPPTFLKRRNDFIEVLKDTTDPDLFLARTPQDRTLTWLVFEDPAVLEPTEVPADEVIQRYVAALLYFSTNGDEWTNTVNFLSEDPICKWNFGDLVGITCVDDVVTSIDLISNNLNGSLPPEIATFTELQQMNIYYNMLTGSIPDLATLTALESIDLDGNALTGKVPESMFTLPALKKLLLLNNPGLTGTIPSNIPNSSPLEQISLYNCGISGSLPDSLGDLPDLVFLQFFNNDLTGTIPPSLTNLPGLELFSFRGNRLSGTIPDFNGQTQLRTISLGENQLEGTIPASLGQLPGLSSLFLQRNRLVGQVPDELDALPALEKLWLYGNDLEGPLPSLSDNPGSLTQLYLNDNQFTGNVESIIDEVPASIQYLGVGNNPTVEGNIPPSIDRLTALVHLNVSHTQVTGKVPQELAQLPFLDELALQSTGITGNLTATLCQRDEFKALTSNCGLFGSLDCECCTACCTDNIFLSICVPNTF